MKERVDPVFNKPDVPDTCYDVVFVEYSLASIRQQFLGEFDEIDITVSFWKTAVSGGNHEQTVFRVNIVLNKILINDQEGQVAMYKYQMFHDSEGRLQRAVISNVLPIQ